SVNEERETRAHEVRGNYKRPGPLTPLTPADTIATALPEILLLRFQRQAPGASPGLSGVFDHMPTPFRLIVGGTLALALSSVPVHAKDPNNPTWWDKYQYL